MIGNTTVRSIRNVTDVPRKDIAPGSHQMGISHGGLPKTIWAVIITMMAITHAGSGKMNTMAAAGKLATNPGVIMATTTGQSMPVSGMNTTAIETESSYQHWSTYDP